MSPPRPREVLLNDPTDYTSSEVVAWLYIFGPSPLSSLAVKRGYYFRFNRTVFAISRHKNETSHLGRLDMNEIVLFVLTCNTSLSFVETFRWNVFEVGGCSNTW